MFFGLTVDQRIRAGQLPPYPYPDPIKLDDVGEIHNKRKPIPYDPGAGALHKNAILGAIGTGKTSCMYLFAEQILAYRASDKDKKIGGLVLEVKGGFCPRGPRNLGSPREGRRLYRIGLGSEYRYTVEAFRRQRSCFRAIGIGADTKPRSRRSGARFFGGQRFPTSESTTFYSCMPRG